MMNNEIPDYKQLIRQAKLARFEHLSLAAGLEAERQGLTEGELEAEMEEIKDTAYNRRQVPERGHGLGEWGFGEDQETKLERSLAPLSSHYE